MKSFPEKPLLHGPDWQAPGRRLLLPAAAGCGKTALTAAEIARRTADLGRVNFYTDSLDNAEAVAAKIPAARVVRGRSARAGWEAPTPPAPARLAACKMIA